MSWSGGKDSSLALYRTLRDGTYDVRALVTTVTAGFDRISMHGVRRELVEAQADTIGIPLVVALIPPDATNSVYEAAMREVLTPFKTDGIEHVICGDLFLRDIREYRERLFRSMGMEAVFPLWNENTTELAREFIDLGFKAVVCSADPVRIPATVASAEYDAELLASLPEACDPCAENGEFHTFVYDGPIFSDRIALTRGEIVERDGFCFADLLAVRRPSGISRPTLTDADELTGRNR